MPQTSKGHILKKLKNCCFVFRWHFATFRVRYVSEDFKV